MQTCNMLASIALFTVNCRVYIFNYLHHYMDKQLTEEAEQVQMPVVYTPTFWLCSFLKPA